MSFCDIKLVSNDENKAILMGMYYQGEYGSTDRDLELGLISAYRLSLDDDDFKSESNFLDFNQYKASQYNLPSFYSGNEVLDEVKSDKNQGHQLPKNQPPIIDSILPFDRNKSLAEIKASSVNKVKEQTPVPDFIKKIDAAFADFVGMSSLKEEVAKQAAYVLMQKLRKKVGLKSTELPSRHMVFTGNPGTG